MAVPLSLADKRIYSTCFAPGTCTHFIRCIVYDGDGPGGYFDHIEHEVYYSNTGILYRHNINSGMWFIGHTQDNSIENFDKAYLLTLMMRHYDENITKYEFWK